MFVVIRFTPMRVRTIGTFRAPDPWNRGQVTDFNLEAYKMVPKGTRRPEDSWGGKELYGIRSELDGAERLLPDSLGVLAVEEKVPKPALPRLLFDITPSLKKGDFNPIWSSKIHYFIGAFFGIVAAACLAMGGSVLVDAGAGAGHVPVRTELATWLARPEVDEENVITERAAKLEGTMRADFAPVVPPEALTYPSPDGSYDFAWIRSARGHRLLLVPAALAASGSASVTGVTMRRAALGVPDATFGKLRARVPDLESDFVTCVFWSWKDGYESAGLGAAFWGILAAISVLGGGIPVLVMVLRKGRRRRQMQWALGRV